MILRHHTLKFQCQLIVWGIYNQTLWSLSGYFCINQAHIFFYRTCFWFPRHLPSLELLCGAHQSLCCHLKVYAIVFRCLNLRLISLWVKIILTLFIASHSCGIFVSGESHVWAGTFIIANFVDEDVVASCANTIFFRFWAIKHFYLLFVLGLFVSKHLLQLSHALSHLPDDRHHRRWQPLKSQLLGLLW